MLFHRAQHIDINARVSDANDDYAVISEHVWQALTEEYTATQGASLLISVQSLADSMQSQPLRTAMQCLCRVGYTQNCHLVIPASWIDKYPTVYSNITTVGSIGGQQKTHRISRIPLSSFTRVIIRALSLEEYNQAIANHAEIVKSLRDGEGVLSQGQMVSVALHSSSTHGSSPMMCRYEVLHTEPSAYGRIEADTNVCVVLGESVSHSDTSPVTVAEENDIYIDESFLAHSMVNSPYLDPNRYGALGKEGLVSTGASDTLEWTFSVKALAKPLAMLWDELTLYTSPHNLGYMGLQSGDWVVISSISNVSWRYARIIPNRTVPPGKIVYASPLLLHNTLQNASLDKARVRIRPTPFGSRKPPAPVAEGITIARVSSPTSTSRSNEETFLNALRQYVAGMPRLVKKGDVLAVFIDTERWAGRPSHEGPMPIAVEQEYPVTSKTPNEVVFFSILNVDYKIPSNTRIECDTSQRFSLGEFGCWMDHINTRVVQAGVDHARVPPVSDYFELSPVHTFVGSTYEKLRALGSATLSNRATKSQVHLSVLLSGSRGVGKTSLVQELAHSLNVHLIQINCYELVGESPQQTELLLRSAFEHAAACSPSIILLRHLEAFSQNNQTPDVLQDVVKQSTEMLKEQWLLCGFPVHIFATVPALDDIPVVIQSLFKHHHHIETPAEDERKNILHSLIQQRNQTIAPDLSLPDLATQTAAFVANDMVDMLFRSERSSIKRTIPRGSHDSGSIYATQITATDVDYALKASRTVFSESIGAPQIPSVSWDDVGGIHNVKANIMDTIQLPLDHPELFSGGMKKRSGILLYGPPGTGKTLVAKAVATSFSLNFFSVKGPELLNMYIGESEANVRRVFQRARDARPCVIFFDELDSIAPKRGNHGDSGGVMDRIVSQLLAELDGVSSGESGSDIFVIGATNRPDLLDPALLRPGRFDRLLYLGVSNTKDSQLDIVRALTRKFKLHPDLSLEDVVAQCPFHFTGADFYALCADALLRAMSRKAEEIDKKIVELNAQGQEAVQPYPMTPQYYLAELAQPRDIEVLVTQSDFSDALSNLVPSVSPAEMEHYRRVQRMFSEDSEA
ncbi:AAA-domain-containing protein [Panus rudis PR-1116 ss-1]|nr:AAA-domain-containing protein [Panus rudis PR-1116 ss-1]